MKQLSKKEKIYNANAQYQHNENKYNNKIFSKTCDFIANDGEKRKRVYWAESSGLNHSEHSHNHVILHLYYETHMAMTIGFSEHDDAKMYVESKGKIDKRIIQKTATQQGWKLKLKNNNGEKNEKSK